MAKSLGSLWLKSIKRMGKAQQVQGRMLMKSLLPKPVRAAPKLRIKPARLAALKPPRQPSAARARLTAALPGVWQKFWYSRSGSGTIAPARRMLYWLYLPSGTAAAQRPLVVMLHGCQQTATDFAAATRMNALAERKGFAVLYPQQSASADSHRCWHWYKRSTQQGQGEVELIAGMIRQVQARHRLDASRTYVAGLSAGAALATIVALRHPELIAAAGLHSAPVFGTSDSAMSAYRAMQQGSVRAHSDAADTLVRRLPGFAGMPAILIHGDRDSVVRRVNFRQLAEQFEIFNASSLSATPPVRRDYPARTGGRSPRHGYSTETRYAGSKPQLVTCEIRALGHAWSGGDDSVAFSAPEGPDASLMMWTFFTRHRRAVPDLAS